jgi:hypothetical protein
LFALCILAGLAALWFIGLQFFAVGKLCPYCLGVHACGLIVAGAGAFLCHYSSFDVGKTSNRFVILRSICFALFGITTLIAGQLFYSPDGYEISEVNKMPPAVVDGGNSEPSVTPEDDLKNSEGSSEDTIDSSDADGPKRQTHLSFGPIEIDASTDPLIGDPNASHLLVKLFDYSCDNCRILHNYLSRYQDERQLSLAIFVLPVPMNVHCNPYISKTGSKHIHACELGKIALAVFAANPGQFGKFHEWMMQGTSPPSVAGAEDYARQLVGADEFQKAMNRSEPDARMQSYVKLFKLSNAGIVPKLIYNSQMIVGTPTEYEKFAAALDKMIGLTQ